MNDLELADAIAEAKAKQERRVAGLRDALVTVEGAASFYGHVSQNRETAKIATRLERTRKALVESLELIDARYSNE